MTTKARPAMVYCGPNRITRIGSESHACTNALTGIPRDVSQYRHPPRYGFINHHS